MHSLSRRLLLAVSLPLALFFGVMMVVLDSGFRSLSERSLKELLDSQMVSLIASADPLPNGSYGLTQWYPHAKAPRAEPEDDDEESEAATPKGSGS